MRIIFGALTVLMIVMSVALSFAPTFAGVSTYVYDEQDRLQEVQYGNGNGIHYEYDKIGNLLSKQVFTPNAHFFDLETSVVGGGAIMPAGNSTVNYGKDQTVVIMPFWGWYVTDVLVDGTSYGPVPTYTLTNVIANHTVSATFVSLEGDVDGDGKVDISDALLANRIALGSVSPTPDQIARGDVYPRLNGQANPDGIITQDDVNLILSKATGLSWPDDPTCVNPVVSCPPGYAFDLSQGRCLSGTLQTKCILTCGNSPVFITATAGGGGLIFPFGVQTVAYGGTRNFTITPFEGYTVSNVTIDGVSQGAIPSHTFTNLTANHSITATFAPNNSYTITPTAGAGGTITPSVITINYGASQTFTITPNAGYHILDVKVDGVSQGAITSYPFTNVTAGHTITASFAADSYSITATALGGGEIWPSGAVSVDCFGNATFTFAPYPGRHLADVLVDGAPAGIVNSYTFSNVSDNHTLTAKFIIPDGDLNQDGIVNISDALLASRIATGVASLTPANLAHGDVSPLVNGKPAPDWIITQDDSNVLLQKAVGLVNWDTTDNVTQPSCQNLPVRIAGATPTYFSTLQAAYDAVADGGKIQTRAIWLIENPTFNRNISLAIEGGYGCDYTTIPGVTYINGMINTSSGSISIKDFNLQN